LKECADMVAALDDRMLSLNEVIQECSGQEENSDSGEKEVDFQL